MSSFYLRLNPNSGYSNYLWPLAHAFLNPDEVSSRYRHRKVWRQGLEVACKVKGSQGADGSQLGQRTFFSAQA